MKYSLLSMSLAGFMFASCAHPLEKIVDAKHQKRVEEAYAGKPLTYGAGDGIGAWAAHSAESRLTLSDKPAR